MYIKTNSFCEIETKTNGYHHTRDILKRLSFTPVTIDTKGTTESSWWLMKIIIFVNTSKRTLILWSIQSETRGHHRQHPTHKNKNLVLVDYHCDNNHLGPPESGCPPNKFSIIIVTTWPIHPPKSPGTRIHIEYIDISIDIKYIHIYIC